MSDETNPYVLFPDEDMDRRPRYYDGQFLSADEFIDEQRYHVDRQRRHARAVTSPGIVRGLEVTSPGDAELELAPGEAIDDAGRQLLLHAAEAVPVAAALNSSNQRLVLTWAEEATDVSSTGEGIEGATRFLEKPTVSFVAEGDDLPAGAVLLASLDVDGAGRITIDASGRRYAGLRLSGPGEVTLESSGEGEVRLSSGLDVTGSAVVGGGLTVGQTSAEGYGGVTNDGNDLVVAGQLSVGGSRGSSIHSLSIGEAAHESTEGQLFVKNTLHVSASTEEVGLALAPGKVIELGYGASGKATHAGYIAYQRFSDGLDIVGAGTHWTNRKITFYAQGGLSMDGPLTLEDPITAQGGVRIPADNALELGHGVSDKEIAAGTLSYMKWSDGLDIVGAGTSSDNRKVTIHAEGGLTVDGPALVQGALTVEGLVRGLGDLEVSGLMRGLANLQVDGTTDLQGGVVMRSRVAIGQDGFEGYGGVTADSNDLVVNGQLAVGGSGGAAMYSLAIGEDARGNSEGQLFVKNTIHVSASSNLLGLTLAAGKTFELAYGDTSKADNSGVIAYGRWTSGLDIVGGGTSVASRTIKLHAQGGVTMDGGLDVAGFVKTRGRTAANASVASMIAWGAVKSDGTLWYGSGVGSVSRPSTGVYEVTFSVHFASAPAVVVSQQYPGDAMDFSSSGGNTRDNAVVIASSTSKIRIKTGDGDGDGTNRCFHFIAMGTSS